MPTAGERDVLSESAKKGGISRIEKFVRLADNCCSRSTVLAGEHV